MKLLVLTILLSVAVSSTAVAQKAKRQPVTAASQPHLNRQLEREILGVESQLGEAIKKRDARLLDRLLTDYFTNSLEGTDRGIGKKVTIAGFQNGELPYYPIDEGRKLSLRIADLVVIEGISNTRAGEKHRAAERQVHVTRFWTKRDGRWQLISQSIGPPDKESEN
jgi:hypothetical protein